MKKLVLTLLIMSIAITSVFAWGAEPQHSIGGEYYVCDEPLNVRDKEGFLGNKIDRLYVGEKVKILGYGKSEPIDGDYEYFWTNVEFHNGKTGWIYGKYIANNTLICDLDKNGTKDYIFIRHKNSSMFYSIDYPADIMIYINGKLMELPDLGKDDFSHAYFYLSKNKEKVLITIENEYDNMPTPDEFKSEWDRKIYLITITKDGIEFADTVTDFDCNIITKDRYNTNELKPEYIEPYLGRGYSFMSNN